MGATQKKYEISDKIWNKIEPHLLGKRGNWGGVGKDNRLFINAVMWILRTGAPWSDLPSQYGDWKNVHRRFCRWRDKGIWEGLLVIFIKDPGFEWIMLDHKMLEVCEAGLEQIDEDQAGMKGRYMRRCDWPWLRMVCRSELLLHRIPRMIMLMLIDKQNLNKNNLNTQRY